MGFKCGIVGLPNVGKSTLFNALTNAGAEAENFPFCTIDPNVGIVPVPDERLNNVAEIVKPKKVTPTYIEVVDIAGLVKGAAEGKGRGNAFLSHIREVDLIVHIVRCFSDDNVVHVEGSIDPIRDIHTIEDELVLKDLESVENREEKLRTQAKGGNKEFVEQLEFVTSLRKYIEEGNKVRNFDISGDKHDVFKDLFLLSSKPVLYVCNISEENLSEPEKNEYSNKVKLYAKEQGDDVIVVCAKIESEIAELDDEEKNLFLYEMGLKESGLDKLIHSAYKNLGLLTFFTANPNEAHAWTIPEGTKAPQAAGKIHTDFEKGFIKAETISYDDFVGCGSEAAVRDAGKMRSEGKDYIVADGDVIYFRFNV